MSHRTITALEDFLRPHVALGKSRLETLCLLIVGIGGAEVGAEADGEGNVLAMQIVEPVVADEFPVGEQDPDRGEGKSAR